MKEIDRLADALEENAEWCDANEWETPLCMGDDQRAAARVLRAIIQAASVAEVPTEGDARLKPCPFCGAPGEIARLKGTHGGWEYIARCTRRTCAGRIYRRWPTERHAARCWNQRPPRPEPTAQGAQIRALQKYRIGVNAPDLVELRKVLEIVEGETWSQNL